MLPCDLVKLGPSCVVGLGKWVSGGFGKSDLGGDRRQNEVREESVEVRK